jgi:hypothetical protein
LPSPGKRLLAKLRNAGSTCRLGLHSSDSMLHYKDNRDNSDNRVNRDNRDSNDNLTFMFRLPQASGC